MTTATPLPADSQSVWLAGARLIDGLGRDPVPRAAVLVENGLIARIAAEPPSGGRVIDCAGLTLTPGLIDAHVHLGLSSDIQKSFLNELSVAELAADMFANCAQTVAEGFTTVRDTGGIDAGLAQVVASGKIIGPRILQCGPQHCQTGGHGHFAPSWVLEERWYDHAVPGLRAFSLISNGADELRRHVREGFRRGADFIKLCVTGGVISRHDTLADTQFTVEEIAVAVQEAKARGTYVTVHAHNNAGIRNAIAAGARCVEHGSEIDDETAALMADNGVAHVPTLITIHELIADSAAAGLPAEMADRVGIALHGQAQGLLASRRAGVRVGLGTDLIGPNQTRRGRELLLRAELESPMDALVAATRVNADILGIAHETGTIEVNKQADIVAFAADPLSDPKVFADPRQVVLVLKSGRVVKDTR
jgi:imidazolonepropionase-like amidohydrolase